MPNYFLSFQFQAIAAAVSPPSFPSAPTLLPPAAHSNWEAARAELCPCAGPIPNAMHAYSHIPMLSAFSVIHGFFQARGQWHRHRMALAAEFGQASTVWRWGDQSWAEPGTVYPGLRAESIWVGWAEVERMLGGCPSACLVATAQHADTGITGPVQQQHFPRSPKRTCALGRTPSPVGRLAAGRSAPAAAPPLERWAEPAPPEAPAAARCRVRAAAGALRAK